MYIKTIVALACFSTILLASCGRSETDNNPAPGPGPTAIAAAEATSAPTSSQGGKEQSAVMASPTAEAPMPTVAPAEPAEPSASSPLAGLIYRLENQLFQIDPDGQSVAIASGVEPDMLPNLFTPRAAVSADGKQMVSWWDWSDLWLVDLTSGESRNLTNTPESQECCAQFWPGRPDTVIFLTRLTDGDGLSYKMAAANLDGSNYRLLDETASPFGLPALSPDASTLAYDPEGKPSLFRWESGPEALNPSDYGLQISAGADYRMTNPSWSPSGAQIAWLTSGGLLSNGIPQDGVVILDLPSKTHQSVHPAASAGVGGGALPAQWSPDSAWLAVFDQSLDQPGVWVMHPDGSGEVLVYAPGAVRDVLGLQALWSPDAQYLLVADPNAAGGIHLVLHNVQSNMTETPSLPAGAIPVAWAR